MSCVFCTITQPTYISGFDPAYYWHLLDESAALAAIFAHDVLSLLVSRDLISPEIAAKILSWRHTGFGVHSKVRTTTLKEAQRVATYMAKPLLALGRLSLNKDHGKVLYRYGKTDGEQGEMEYLDFIARVTAHIPDKGQAMTRYYGLYSNAHRGKERKRGQAFAPLPIGEPPPARKASQGWRELKPSLPFPGG